MTVTVSVAVSADGYMDDSTERPLVLSSPEDWQEVYALRAECDAILVGAQTVRKDNPGLRIKSEELRRQRITDGRPADIMRVTVSESGNIPVEAKFFARDGRKIVFVAQTTPDDAVHKLSQAAEVVRLDRVTAREIVDSLACMGVHHLMVEGGSSILKMFFDQNEVDRLRLAIAPVMVGDRSAPRFDYMQQLLAPNDRNTHLERVHMAGPTAVLDFAFDSARREEDVLLLRQAIEQSRLCLPCSTAYSVGAVLKTVSGNTYAGYTHQSGPANHAEEEVIAQALNAGDNLSGATIYSSMEPCSKRASKPLSCSELIVQYGIARVVYAYAEPECFVHCTGTEFMRRNNIEVTVIDSMASEVRHINSHIIDR